MNTLSTLWTVALILVASLLGYSQTITVENLERSVDVPHVVDPSNPQS